MDKQLYLNLNLVSIATVVLCTAVILFLMSTYLPYKKFPFLGANSVSTKSPSDHPWVRRTGTQSGVVHITRNTAEHKIWTLVIPAWADHLRVAKTLLKTCKNTFSDLLIFWNNFGLEKSQSKSLKRYKKNSQIINEAL